MYLFENLRKTVLFGRAPIETYFFFYKATSDIDTSLHDAIEAKNDLNEKNEESKYYDCLISILTDYKKADKYDRALFTEMLNCRGQRGFVNKSDIDFNMMTTCNSEKVTKMLLMNHWVLGRTYYKEVYFVHDDVLSIDAAKRFGISFDDKTTKYIKDNIL